MWVVEGVTENGQRAEQGHCSLSDPSHTYSFTVQQQRVTPPGEHLRLRPFTAQVHQDKKKMAQMKEQIKAPEKIQLSEEEIANLLDAQFKTLVIRMLTYG